MGMLFSKSNYIHNCLYCQNKYSKLDELMIYKCPNIKYIEDFSNIKLLTTLHIFKCNNIKYITTNTINTKLRTLCINHCSNIDNINNISNIINL